ncbi:MAG: hypothetical protein HY326_01210 [Chloroflexi bacterium]|nr:hypothetical protein [Chloroflexota bacterium]
MSSVLDLPTLEKNCEKCHGKGHVYNPAWVEYYAKLEDWALGEIGFEPPERPATPEQIICEECQGYGTILTNEGYQIMHIVERAVHARAMHDTKHN